MVDERKKADTDRARELGRQLKKRGDTALAGAYLENLADEVDQLREENEKLRINEGPLLMAALTEVNEVWLPLLAAAKEHKCDCSESAPANCRGRVCCELVHAIAACEAE